MIWDYVWQDSITPSSASLIVAVIALALSLAIVTFSKSWRIARFFVTLIHEWSHAMAAVMVGRRLKSIVLNFDSSGVTGSTGKGKGLGVIIKTMAGYPGPALMGLLIAYLISIDKVNLALLVLASTSLLLLFVRNLFGIVSIVTWNTLVIGTLWLDNSTLSLVVASGCSAILMIGSVKATLELRARGDKNDGTVSDSDALGQATFISSSVWTMFFIAVCMTSTVAGSALLLL